MRVKMRDTKIRKGGYNASYDLDQTEYMTYVREARGRTHTRRMKRRQHLRGRPKRQRVRRAKIGLVNESGALLYRKEEK